MDALMLEDPDDAEDIFLIERLHLQGSAFDIRMCLSSKGSLFRSRHREYKSSRMSVRLFVCPFPEISGRNHRSLEPRYRQGRGLVRTELWQAVTRMRRCTGHPAVRL